MIKPRPTDNRFSDRIVIHAMDQPAGMADTLELPEFERFVFVMSVLERHSFQESALLLGCTCGDVIAARTRALERIATKVGCPAQT